MVDLDRVPSKGQIELLDHLTVCKQMTDSKLNRKTWNCFNYVQTKLLILDRTLWNHLSVCKHD